MVGLGRASPWSGRVALVWEGKPESSYAARAAFEVDGSSQSSSGGASVASVASVASDRCDHLALNNKENIAPCGFDLISCLI